MTKRIIAIAVIFIFTSLAWTFLGGTTASRTSDSNNSIRSKVMGLWGKPQTQAAPSVCIVVPKKTSHQEVTVDEKTKKESTKTVEQIVDERSGVELASSDITADLKLDQRKKGLLWYSLYKIRFHGAYTATAPADATTGRILVTFPFPSADTVFDDFVFKVNGKDVEFRKDAVASGGSEGGCGGTLTYSMPAAPGEKIAIEVGYSSQGMDEWIYDFGGGAVQKVTNFRLNMTTDFDDVDFPGNTLSATTKEKSGEGWKLTWDYKNLISGNRLGMSMPRKIDPGPLASSISYFAPVSLLFFFVFLFIISVIKDIKIHPMNYAFLAASFFAFHLLFSYTVDHINIYVAFVISSIVSVGLVVSYLRLVVDKKFAYTYAAISQIVYLVFFSYAFFLEGFTGLTVTIGAIFTLFALMQLTGKMDWEEKFRSDDVKPRNNLRSGTAGGFKFNELDPKIGEDR